MLMPRRVKFRKQQRGRLRGKAERGDYVCFGDFGIQALKTALITNRQIESARVVLTRKLQKGGKYWIRVFPHKSMTKKPNETRMGKGKGEPEVWVARVKRGKVLFEFDGIPEDIARRVAQIMTNKLPIPVRLVLRDQIFI